MFSWMRHLGAKQRTLKKESSMTNANSEQMVADSAVPWMHNEPPEELVAMYKKKRDLAQERILR